MFLIILWTFLMQAEDDINNFFAKIYGEKR